MKASTILNLRIGDLVANDRSEIGKVIGFDRDHVAIEWVDGSRERYTDEGLKTFGVALVDGQ